MWRLVGRAAIPVGVLIALAGIVASTPASGFIDSVIFWGIVGLVVAAIGAGLADRQGGYR